MSRRPVIYWRTRTVINTDPQRRCYDGCHFSSEVVWTRWSVQEDLQDLKPDTDPEARLKFWRDLNDYSVSKGGAKREFKLEVPND